MKNVNKIALIGAIGLAAVTSFGATGAMVTSFAHPSRTPSYTPTTVGHYHGTYRLDSNGGRVANDCDAWARSLDNPLRSTSADISLSITLCETWPK